MLRLPGITNRFTNTPHLFGRLLGRHIAGEQFVHKLVWPSAVALRRWGEDFDSETDFYLMFQFVWYEIIPKSGVELGRAFGNLYRDSKERKLQKQSCLVSHCVVGNFIGIITNRVGERLLESLRSR